MNTSEYLPGAHSRETALEVFSTAQGDCHKRPETQIAEEMIGDVLFARQISPDGYGSGDGLAIVRLTDGRLAVASEWSDTSGHG